MKKFLLLICAFLPVLAFAQPGPLDVNIGLKAGMNFTRLQGSTWTGGYRSGILAGAFGSVGVKKIAGQIEALVSTTTFTGQGRSFQDAGLLLNPVDSTSQGSFSAVYLHIPVLLNLKMFGNASIQLGPQFSSLLSAKDKDGILNTRTSTVFNTSDFAGVVGLQLKLPAKLNAGIRYTFGLSDQNLSSVGESWKLGTIQIHLGFSFL
ncbi:MAG: PorT family protein [Chitinophagaceae bacterium]|nr:PorT family protein [Chitinophagaceae bacterium]